MTGRLQVGPATVWFASDRDALLATDIPVDVREEVAGCVEIGEPFWVEVDRMRPGPKHGPRPSAVLYGFDEPRTFAAPAWWKAARREGTRATPEKKRTANAGTRLGRSGYPNPTR